MLTDMVMPGEASGLDVAQHCIATKPTLKVIYTSGYSPELIGTEFETETGHVFLPKPYHSDRLANLVSTCLHTSCVSGEPESLVSDSRSDVSTASSAALAN